MSRRPRFIAIHGHFYQPPRESPWLERIEAQVRHPENRILDVVDNCAALAFDVGPTLMTWLERERPDGYRAILEADRVSRVARGHGNAIAQAYRNAIFPLCSRRDKVTQVRWGLADFR